MRSQTWLDETLFGWTRSARRGTSAWAGSHAHDTSRAPTPDPLGAVRSGAARIAARQHLEEDLDFREHEWLLQQIGCGRVEIWVTEERVERTEAGEEQRPRVFFAPPPLSSGRQSASGAS